MTVGKSERHSKIAGDFGEYFVLYWLSKAGFNCARVDHVGIDLYVFEQKMGISVKYMTLKQGKPSQGINKENLKDAETTCKKYGWNPYIALVFVHDNSPEKKKEERITLFMCPTEIFRKICTESKTKYRINLRDSAWDTYRQNTDVHYIVFEIGDKKWF